MIKLNGPGDARFYPGGPTVGHYRMSAERSEGTIVFALKSKPRLWHRLMVRLFFGWAWVDEFRPGSGYVEPTINGKPWPNAEKQS